MSEWIDITIPLYPGVVVWPGDPEFELRKEVAIEKGDECNLSAFSMCAHTGTHIDAPLHYLADGVSLDALDFESFAGPARVIHVDVPRIGSSELADCDIAPGERLLFKTRNSEAVWHDRPFTSEFVHLTPDGAHFLVERQVRMVGIDYLSVGSDDRTGAETHCILLGGGVWILEGLNLKGVAEGRYELMCLPLKIAGAEGAPARAVLRRVR